MNDSDANSPWDKPTRWDANDESASTPPMPITPPPASMTPPQIPDPSPGAASEPAALPVYGAPAAADVFATSGPGAAASGPRSSAVGSPVLSGDYGSTVPPIPEAPGRSGSGRFAWIAAVVGALALLGGGGFFALSALGASGGAATPEEAVDKLIESVNNEDFVTLAEMLEPGERRTLAEPALNDILPELVRLGILDDTIDPAALAGVNFELTDVEYDIELVTGAEGLAHVQFTGGSATVEFDAQEFPVGDVIRTRFGDEIEDVSNTEAIEDDGVVLVLVQRDDRWYASYWYTLGENARLEMGESLPSVAEQPPALGSDSPEEAVEALVAEMVELDLDGMIGRLDPDEASALYRYSPLFLNEGQSVLNEVRRSARDEDITWDVTDMQFDVDGDGDDAIVRITAFTATVSSPDFNVRLEYGPDRIFLSADGNFFGEDFEGTIEVTPTRWVVRGSASGETLDVEVLLDADAQTVAIEGSASGETFSASFKLDDDGICSNYSFEGFGQSGSGCLEDELNEDDPFTDQFTAQVNDAFTQLKGGFPGIPIAAHKTDGKWFVSPTGTATNATVEYLRLLEKEDIEEGLDGLLFGMGGMGFGGLGGMGMGGVGLLDAVGTTTDIADFVEGESVFEEIPLPDDFVTPDFGADLESVEFAVVPEVGPTAYRDRLAGSDEHVYLVDMTEGQILQATLYGSDAMDGGIGDPNLIIEDPSGNWYDQNDDYDSLNSGLGFTANQSGAWRVIVRELSLGTGGYELTLDLVDAGQTPTLLDGISPEVTETTTLGAEAALDSVDSIMLGITLITPTVTIGSLTSGTFDLFEVDLPAGEDVVIQLEAADGVLLDTMLVLLDDSNNIVAQNDDALDETDSRIEFTIDGGGTYFIEARSFADVGEGDYTLTVCFPRAVAGC